MKKVLTSDLTDTNSFANKLQDKRFKTFAAAFNFNTKGAVTSVTPNRPERRDIDRTRRPLQPESRRLRQRDSRRHRVL